MTVTTAPTAEATEIAPAAGVRFTVASRPMRRFSATQTVNIANGGTSFAPIMLPATGFVRRLSFLFEATMTAASAGAVVAGDGPFNLVDSLTVTDATGQPIYQPISGYNLYLVNKYLTNPQHHAIFGNNPVMGPEYAYSSTATTGTAVFRLDVDFEQDYRTGYGCIPNLDSNASLQVKIDAGPITRAFSGTNISAASLKVTVDQYYWAPIGSSMGGVPVRTTPPGFGDFLEMRYENQAATPNAENTVQATNRGGLIKGIIAVSRASATGARVAYAPGTNVGLVYDNNAIDEGIRVESQYDEMRRHHGYLGTDAATSYAPLTPGVVPGLDRGVLVWNFDSLSDNRDSWLSTRVGTLLQLKVTPGATADRLELITGLMQVKDAAAFYGD